MIYPGGLKTREEVGIDSYPLPTHNVIILE